MGYFLALYDAVGRDYEWQDGFEQAERDPPVFRPSWPAIRTCDLDGDGHGLAPHGVLRARGAARPGVCDLAYFGLVPRAVGVAGGRALAGNRRADRVGAKKGVDRMNRQTTCTFDHTARLALYQKLGFTPIAREARRRVLVHGAGDTVRGCPE